MPFLDAKNTMAASALAFSSPSPRYTEEFPGEILFREFGRVTPGLDALGIRFSVSRVKFRIRGGKRRKPPYFACCYNIGNLGDVNVVAFYYPLIGGSLDRSFFQFGNPAITRRTKVRDPAAITNRFAAAAIKAA